MDVSSSTRITTYQSLQIQLVQNAPEDGPMRSETCRAKLKCWLKLTHWDHSVYLVGLHIYLVNSLSFWYYYIKSVIINIICHMSIPVFSTKHILPLLLHSSTLATFSFRIYWIDRLYALVVVYIIFQKSGRNLKILNATKLLWSKFYTEDPEY